MNKLNIFLKDYEISIWNRNTSNALKYRTNYSLPEEQNP